MSFVFVDGQKLKLVSANGKSKFLTGQNSDDYLDGSIASEQIFGGKGNDYVKGGRGNDTIDGGSGFDTALFAGSVDNYAFSWISGRLRIAGPDGTDILSNIEQLKFGNTFYRTDGVIARSDHASGTENQTIKLDLLANDLSLAKNGALALQKSSGGNAQLVGDIIGTTTEGAPVRLLDIDGTVAVVPGKAYDHLAVGEVLNTQFTYKVSNGNEISTATASIKITGESEPVVLPSVIHPVVIGRIEKTDHKPGSQLTTTYSYEPGYEYLNKEIVYSYDRPSEESFSAQTVVGGPIKVTQGHYNNDYVSVPYPEGEMVNGVWVTYALSNHYVLDKEVEEQAVFEFDVSQVTAPVTRAVLHFSVEQSGAELFGNTNWNGFRSSYAYTFDTGDGVVTLDDYSDGTVFHGGVNPNPFGAFGVEDLTIGSYINDLIAKERLEPGPDYLSFNIRADVDDWQPDGLHGWNSQYMVVKPETVSIELFYT